MYRESLFVHGSIIVYTSRLSIQLRDRFWVVRVELKETLGSSGVRIVIEMALRYHQARVIRRGLCSDVSVDWLWRYRRREEIPSIIRQAQRKCPDLLDASKHGSAGADRYESQAMWSGEKPWHQALDQNPVASRPRESTSVE